MKKVISIFLFSLVLCSSLNAGATIVTPCNCQWWDDYSTQCPTTVVTYYVDDQITGCGCYNYRLAGYPVTAKYKLCGSTVWTQILYIQEEMVKNKCNNSCTA